MQEPCCDIGLQSVLANGLEYGYGTGMKAILCHMSTKVKIKPFLLLRPLLQRTVEQLVRWEHSFPIA